MRRRRAFLASITATTIAGCSADSSDSTEGSDEGPSSKPQDYKPHTIQFKIEENDGKSSYDASVLDPDPDLEDLEIGGDGKGGDTVNHYGDHTEITGNLDSTRDPLDLHLEDTIEFAGSTNDSDFDWEADGDVRVILDGEIQP